LTLRRGTPLLIKCVVEGKINCKRGDKKKKNKQVGESKSTARPKCYNRDLKGEGRRTFRCRNRGKRGRRRRRNDSGRAGAGWKSGIKGGQLSSPAGKKSNSKGRGQPESKVSEFVDWGKAKKGEKSGGYPQPSGKKLKGKCQRDK